MVGRRLKGSPCLQRDDEGPTIPNALGRTSYTPNPRSPEGFRNPAQSAPEHPCPGRGFRNPSPVRACQVLLLATQCPGIGGDDGSFHTEFVRRAGLASAETCPTSALDIGRVAP
jgi:hypothetical protein